MAIAYVVAGIVCCILIITIPFGIASFRIANYALWPFGRTVVAQADRPGLPRRSATSSGCSSPGIWLAIGHVVTGVALCITIIGIPLGIGSFKMIPISLLPLGAEIVDADTAGPMTDLAGRWPLADLTEVRDALLAAYATGRGYHDTRHLAEVLDRVEELRGAGETFEHDAVALAAWFHDGVYDGQPGAEERSAQWATGRPSAARPVAPRWPGWCGSPRPTVPRTTTATAACSPTPTWRSWPRRRRGTASTSPTCGTSTPTSPTTCSRPAARPCSGTCWPSRRSSTPPTPAPTGSPPPAPTSRPSCRRSAG